ncbi:GntR family transcriptional regulator [Lactobacillus kefiranofaciens]|nr:GntR family transcriptional regulator [Lactobacillus kefiranofaciens]
MQNNLTAQAYSILLKKIITAELKPGEKISEKQVEQDLGIGRTPVREALLHLRQEHLIYVVPQSGTYIAQIDLASVINARFVRISVEQQIMQEAAQHPLTELQRAQLKDIIQQQKLYCSEKDFHQFFKYDDLFHQLFYEITGHDIVWNWLKEINIQFDRFRFLSLNLGNASWNNLIQDHQTLLDTVLAGKSDEVKSIVTKHLQLVIDEKNTLVNKYPRP